MLLRAQPDARQIAESLSPNEDECPWGEQGASSRVAGPVLGSFRVGLDLLERASQLLAATA